LDDATASTDSQRYGGTNIPALDDVEILQPKSAEETAEEIRERLISRRPEGTLDLVRRLIESLVESEKLRRFVTATEKDKGHVLGMASIAAEIRSIETEIEQRRKKENHG